VLLTTPFERRRGGVQTATINGKGDPTGGRNRGSHHGGHAEIGYIKKKRTRAIIMTGFNQRTYAIAAC